MKKTIALILTLVLCLGVLPLGSALTATAADTNLLYGSSYTYIEYNSFLGSCTDSSSKYLTDGNYRDEAGDFNDFYGVPGTTVEVAGTYSNTVIEFSLDNASVVTSVVLRAVRRSGNRYTKIVSIEVSSDGSSYSTVAFKETQTAISGAPMYAVDEDTEIEQYFDVTAAFNTPATNVTKIKFTFNTLASDGYKYVVSLDEIEAYGTITSPYVSKASIDLSADSTSVRPGDLFTVTATLKDITVSGGVVACDLPLNYDTELLELVSVKEICPDSWGGSGLLVCAPDKTATPYWLRLICDAADLLTNSAYYVKTSGVLGFSLTFKALKTGNASVTIDNDGDAMAFPMIVDANGFVNYGAEGESISIGISNDASAPSSFMIVYDANGGSGAPDTQTKNAGATVNLSSVVPARPGYTFLGWSEGSGAPTAQYAPGAAYSDDKSVVLYAVWVANDVDGILGDVNGDNYVDSADAVLVLQYDAGLISFSDSQVLLGNVDGDGRTDSADASLILRYDLGLVEGF